ncbi:MAG: substrate-binding domain-containing protein [Armatimonadota bacterium]
MGALKLNSRNPLYAQLKELVKEDIFSGRLQPGTRLPSTLEMARDYRVCHKTVQLAMQALTKEGFLVRRPRYGTVVADLPGHLLQKRKTGRLVLVVDYLDDGFLSGLFVRELVEGVRSAVEDAGWSLDTSVYSNFRPATDEGPFDGCLLLRPSREMALRIKKQGIPTILLDVQHPRSGLSFVQTDNADGIRQGLEHLVSLGHRRILYAHSDLTAPINHSGRERYRAFLEHASALRLPTDGYTIPAEELKARRGGPEFSAILTDGYSSTRHTLNQLRQMAVEWPRDLSIVAFDDIELAEHMLAPLTVIRQNLFEVGRIGCQSLISGTGLNGMLRAFVPPQLIVRASTRSIR